MPKRDKLYYISGINSGINLQPEIGVLAGSNREFDTRGLHGSHQLLALSTQNGRFLLKKMDNLAALTQHQRVPQM